MPQKHHGKFRIGVADSRIIKAGRDRISGVMRYASTHDNWEVRILSIWSSYGLTANETQDYDKLDALLGGSNMINGIVTMLPRTVPIVCIDSKATVHKKIKVDACVNIDDAAIGAAAADIFLKGGLRHLAYVGVCGLYEQPYQHDRLRAFRHAARAAGIHCDVFIPLSDTDEKDDLSELAEWLAQLPRPCGIMAYSDNRAQTVLDACRMAHLRVPEQIQLVGVDNEIEICENMQPTLTSILPDFEGGGYLAAQLLDDILMHRIRSHRPICRSYGIKSIVVRASTQDLKGGGRIVSQACEFIRLHAQDQITVKDVAAHLNLARRTLEMRFREVLGNGVAEVLRRERLNRVARLLRETDRPISDIAYDSGFASPTHLMAAFKRFAGVTMKEWRSHGRPT